MKFAASIEHLQDKAKIAEVRPVHRQYLATLKADKLDLRVSPEREAAVRGGRSRRANVA